jgi:IS605 OrfB family transposase
MIFRLEKNAAIKATGKATRERRSLLTLKVYTLKLDKSHLSQAKLDLSGVSTLVVEDLDLVDMKRKGGKSNKNFRKTLANWNIRLLQWRLSSRCELNRVQFAKVDPAYSSQQCSSCGNVRKESRKGERYDCPHCGASLDADRNAAMNIRNRFRGGEPTAPHERKHSTLCKIE